MIFQRRKLYLQSKWSPRDEFRNASKEQGELVLVEQELLVEGRYWFGCCG
jgi:hypothetical protein